MTSARLALLQAKLKQELNGTEASADTRRKDLRARIDALTAQLRGGAITQGREMTAEGHIRQAILKLTRELGELK